MNDDKWEEIKKHLEPIGKAFYATPYDDIQLSIAISLKRMQKPEVRIRTNENTIEVK